MDSDAPPSLQAEDLDRLYRQFGKAGVGRCAGRGGCGRLSTVDPRRLDVILVEAEKTSALKNDRVHKILREAGFEQHPFSTIRATGQYLKSPSSFYYLYWCWYPTGVHNKHAAQHARPR